MVGPIEMKIPLTWLAVKRITIKVVPNARKPRIVEAQDGFKVYVSAPAEGGRANAAVIVLLADFFGVAPKSVRIVSGERLRRKIVEIATP